MYLILVLANASILTNRIFPIIRAKRSFVTIFSIETVETIAPKVPVTKNGKFHVRFLHITVRTEKHIYIEIEEKFSETSIVNESRIDTISFETTLSLFIFYVENFQSYS